MWELIIDGAIDGKSNMAIDSALFEEVTSSSTPRTIVRFYRWSRPTLSLGRNQKIEKAVDTDYCTANGIDLFIARREDVPFCMMTNSPTPSSPTTPSHSGIRFTATTSGLGSPLPRIQHLGVAAVLAPDTKKSGFERMAPTCRASFRRRGTNSWSTGRKVVGSAQRRVRDTFCQHGSMPITCDREALASATRLARLEPSGPGNGRVWRNFYPKGPLPSNLPER